MIRKILVEIKEFIEEYVMLSLYYNFFRSLKRFSSSFYYLRIETIWVFRRAGEFSDATVLKCVHHRVEPSFPEAMDAK